MNVFLTGGTGFIGQPLTQALLARGWNITALVRNPNSPQARILAEMGITCVPGDITDRSTMRSAVAGADMIVHNAAWYEVGITPKARARMYRINVTGTDNLLSLAQEFNISRTVYVSSTVYYGHTGTEPCDETYQRQFPYRFYYEQSKAEAHKVAMRYQKHGLPLILICPAHVVGPNDHSAYGYFQRLYLNRLAPPFAWAPDVVHSSAHVEDVAEGIALAAEKGRIGETYILAGEPTSMRQLFQIWATHPGGLRIRFFAPFWLAKAMFTVAEPMQRLLGLPAFASRETVAGSEGSLNFSSAKAQRELGWSPRSAHAMWADVFEKEQALLAARTKHDLLSRLKPMERHL